MQNNDLTLQSIIEISNKDGEKRKQKKNWKNLEIFHDCMSVSAISEFLRLRSRVWKKLRSRLRLQPDERALRALLKWAALTKALAINNIFYCENVTFSGFLNYVLTLLSQIALTFLLDIDKCSFKVKGKGKPFFE